MGLAPPSLDDGPTVGQPDQGAAAQADSRGGQVERRQEPVVGAVGRRVDHVQAADSEVDNCAAHLSLF